MSWQTITAADVLQEWNAKEQGLVNDQQAADNLANILARVVNQCRACVRAGGGQVGPDATIPDQLREEVIAIARWRLLLSLPEVEETIVSEARKAAYTDAVARFDKVSAGTIKVEVPDAPLATTGPSNAVSVPRPGRNICMGGFDKMGAS